MVGLLYRIQGAGIFSIFDERLLRVYMEFRVRNVRKGVVVVRGCSYGAFPKLGVFLGGFPILRTVVFWDLYWGRSI